ncbi:MAG: hypothetical protein K2H59_03730 [Muribaculaceae bacterium]|nr:hypothetical protein [Muribaculaceae bacterium]
MDIRTWQTASEIKDFLTGLENESIPSSEAREGVRSLMARYPFFELPLALLLKNYPGLFEDDDALRNEALKTVAAKSSDPEVFFKMQTPDASVFDNFYPKEEKESMSTGDAIDEFLNTYGEEDPGESALLERLIFNPVGDWSTRLEIEENKEHKKAEPETVETEKPVQSDETLERIGSYIEAHPDTSRITPQRREKKASTQPAADTLLSQSLAKIYVKQRRYDKAYEIISQLSLNYPEKSCYFADQLRFLKKLIISQQQKTTN